MEIPYSKIPERNGFRYGVSWHESDPDNPGEPFKRCVVGLFVKNDAPVWFQDRALSDFKELVMREMNRRGVFSKWTKITALDDNAC